MKALVMTAGDAQSLERWLHRKKRPNLAWLVSTLEKLGADEVLITGGGALKSPIGGWFERERGRFRTPVTLRFHDEFREPSQIASLIRVVRHECLEDSLVLLSPDESLPEDLRGLGDATRLYLHSPVIGVRKLTPRLARVFVSIGERNRITRFSSNGQGLDNDWEPAGVYYFPERFVSDGLPAFMKSSFVSQPAFESFLSWSVRNFKVYAHVFAAHSGL
jgi:hypothetical protein